MSSLSGINAKAAEAMARLSASERRLLGGLVLVLLAVAPIKAASWSQEAAARHETAQAELDRAQRAAGRASGTPGATVKSSGRPSKLVKPQFCGFQ